MTPGWSDDFIEEVAFQGATRIFSHCPPAINIRYTKVTVDDELDDVEVVCPGPVGVTSVYDNFFFLETPGELLVSYQSSGFKVPDGCRVDFTVRDTLALNIGVRVEVRPEP